MKNNYVFTYGTLLKGERNHHLLNDEEYIDIGSISGFTMFNLGTYPGIKSGNGIVVGELYLIDDSTLQMLDELEEEGTLYIRQKTNVHTRNGDFEAFVYIYNQEVTNPVYIGEGFHAWKNRDEECW